jgi:hypothetical protein
MFRSLGKRVNIHFSRTGAVDAEGDWMIDCIDDFLVVSRTEVDGNRQILIWQKA